MANETPVSQQSSLFKSVGLAHVWPSKPPFRRLRGGRFRQKWIRNADAGSGAELGQRPHRPRHRSSRCWDLSGESRRWTGPEASRVTEFPVIYCSDERFMAVETRTARGSLALVYQRKRGRLSDARELWDIKGVRPGLSSKKACSLAHGSAKAMG